MTPDEAVQRLIAAFLGGEYVPPVEFERLLELSQHADNRDRSPFTAGGMTFTFGVPVEPPLPDVTAQPDQPTVDFVDFFDRMTKAIDNGLKKQPRFRARRSPVENVDDDAGVPPMSREAFQRLWESEPR